MSSQSLTTRFVVNAGTPAGGDGWMRTVPVRRQKRPQAGGVWAMIAAAYRRHRTRAALAGLDADMLKDIGVSRAEAEYEANKPFWRG